MRRPAVYVLFALSALLASAAGARAENLVSLRAGSHRYAPGQLQSVVGLAYDHRFGSLVSLGLGGDWISNDVWGHLTGVSMQRVSLGAGFSLFSGCLLPLEITPGLGLELDRRRMAGTADEAAGVYARAAGYLRIMPGFAVGLSFRRSWSRLEALGQETALEARVGF